MNNYTFRVFIYPGEDDYLIASVPSLPGCYSQGKTIEEALKNIQEAATAYLEANLLEGERIPAQDEKIIESFIRILPNQLHKDQGGQLQI